MESLQQIIKSNIREMSTNRPENIDRRSGRTTRLVDEYIQVIFTSPLGTYIQINDHHYNGSLSDHIMASKFLLNILLRRLQIEHGIQVNVPFTRGITFIMKVFIKNDIEIVILPHEGDKKSS